MKRRRRQDRPKRDRIDEHVFAEQTLPLAGIVSALPPHPARNRGLQALPAKPRLRVVDHQRDRGVFDRH